MRACEYYALSFVPVTCVTCQPSDNMQYTDMGVTTICSVIWGSRFSSTFWPLDGPSGAPQSLSLRTFRIATLWPDLGQSCGLGEVDLWWYAPVPMSFLHFLSLTRALPKKGPKISHSHLVVSGVGSCKVNPDCVRAGSEPGFTFFPLITSLWCRFRNSHFTPKEIEA